MSEQGNKSQNRGSKPRRNRPYKYKGKGSGGNKNSSNKGQGNNAPAKNKKFASGRSRRPKTLSPTRIVQKYDNLMEQYLVARKKFFDLFGKGNTKQTGKAESNYHNALQTLRSFGTKLEDWQQKILDEKINSLPEDRQYSTDHNLSPEGDQVSFVGEFEDPHLLPTQKDTEWSKDSEESEGTMDDYYQYKGITPPTPEELEEKRAKLEAKERRERSQKEAKENRRRDNRGRESRGNRNKDGGGNRGQRNKDQKDGQKQEAKDNKKPRNNQNRNRNRNNKNRNQKNKESNNKKSE